MHTSCVYTPRKRLQCFCCQDAWAAEPARWCRVFCPPIILLPCLLYKGMIAYANVHLWRLRWPRDESPKMARQKRRHKISFWWENYEQWWVWSQHFAFIKPVRVNQLSCFELSYLQPNSRIMFALYVSVFLNNTINILQTNIGFGRVTSSSFSLHFTIADMTFYSSVALEKNWCIPMNKTWTGDHATLHNYNNKRKNFTISCIQIGFNASKDIQEWMATVNLNLLT